METDTETITPMRKAPSPPPHFFSRLPLEVRDITYRFTYSDPYPEFFPIVSIRRSLTDDARRRHRHNGYKFSGVRPLAGDRKFMGENEKCPFEGMVVCKGWYYEARVEWLR